jgi:hypothetical protein
MGMAITAPDLFLTLSSTSLVSTSYLLMRNCPPHLRRILVLALPLLAIGLAGCNRPPTANAADAPHPSTPATAASQSPSPASPANAAEDSSPADLGKTLGVHCDDETKGLGCVAGNVDAGDFYDVELSPSCGAEGFFAGVAEAEASLLNTLPVTGSKAQVNAKLSQGQFVCVQATARTGQQPAYYYVIAIPAATVSACQGKPICSQYGDRSISFAAQPKTGNACALATNGRYQGDCAQGWVDPQRLDVFSNGL